MKAPFRSSACSTLTLFCVLVTAFARFPLFAAVSEGPSINFEATDLEGRPFHALSLKGDFILLDFWAVWCAPCVAAFPKLKKLQADFGDDGFQILAIAVYSGTALDVRKFLDPHELNYTTVLGDEELVARFGVIGYPTYFLIAPDGSIYKKYVGEMPLLREEVASDIAAIRAGVEPEPDP